jgi:hypothetical protein
MPPIDLPDLEKKAPKPKFIKPEKKLGVPTASKVKPQSSAEKTAAKKAAQTAARTASKTAAKKSAKKP